MAFGIRCNNEKGETILEITDRLTRVIGVYQPKDTTNGDTGSITVSLAGNIFAYVCLNSAYVDSPKMTTNGLNYVLAIDQTNRTINFIRINSPIVYGVY